jgi:hypothetical protein
VKIATIIQEKLNAFADTLKQIFTINSDVDCTFTNISEQVVGDFLKTATDRPDEGHRSF